MYLTQVELNGFKSFPDRTVFDFESGITAILGPNGCGKSNIVDAVKWVLGERSARSLRATEMTDVIFAGTERRKPLGMAEVHLHFDNQDGKLPIEYNEVCVTRRLYRSGESEYELNRQRCTLREIRELFMDTGLGASAYSIIEQGRVEELLAAKPSERRVIFEEAAGVARFKARRKETLARLDRTRQNLQLVDTTISELERGIRRVSRQAAGARRYQRLKGQFDALRLHACCRQFLDLRRRLAGIEAQRAEMEQLFAQESARAAETAQAMAALTGEELDRNQALQAQDQAATAAQEHLSRVASDLAAASARRQALEQAAQAAAERIGGLEDRLAGLQAEAGRSGAAEQEVAAALRQAQEAVQAHESAREAAQAKLADADRRLEALRRSLFEAAEQRADARAATARNESEAQAIGQRREALATRQGRIAAEAEALLPALASVEEALRHLDADVEALRRAVHVAQSEERRGREQAERLAQELAHLHANRSAQESRRALLADLEQSLAGAFSGVKAVLTAKREAHPDCAAVEGMVADVIAVAPEHALAIETALGSQAQNLIVPTALDAQRAIEYLKRERAGRATFLPLDRIRPRPRLDRALLARPGVVGEAADLVRQDPRYQPAVEHLLAGTLVCETLAQARELSGTEARGVRIVTLEGEIIHASGAMTGGQGREARGGLIVRKAELEALAAALPELDAVLAQAEAARRQALAAIQTATAAAASGSAELAAAVERRSRLAQDLSLRQGARERLAQEGDALRAELKSLDTAAQRLATESLALAGRAAALDEQEQQDRRRLAEIEEQQRLERIDLDRLGEDVARLRERRAEVQSRLEEAGRQRQALAAEQSEREREVAACRDAVAQAAAERAALAEREEALRAQEAGLLATRDAARSAATALREELHRLRDRLQTLREEERAAQKRVQQLLEAQSGLRVQENECQVRMEALDQKAREELQVTDLAARADALEREPASPPAGQAPEVAPAEDAGEEGMGWPAEGEAAFPRMPLEAISALIESIAGRIQRLGPINLAAMDELAEIETRLAFLQGERDDLQAAVDDLLKVIARLSAECHRQFEETFAIVRGNFQEMFRKLFGGGKGDLVLEPAEDPLESGVEIIARPPGKEPTSISLLSGGEKALCAVALLFAILRSKPSPFCILDEVDGPLDESNIDRFMATVREFAKDTQFLLISHSKRTMGMTDTIYGVTQDEPGVSKKYSLKFRAAYGEEADRKTREPEAEEVAAG